MWEHKSSVTVLQKDPDAISNLPFQSRTVADSTTMKSSFQLGMISQEAKSTE